MLVLTGARQLYPRAKLAMPRCSGCLRCGSAAIVGVWGDFGGVGPLAFLGGAVPECRSAVLWCRGASLAVPAALLQSLLHRRPLFHPFPCNFLILGEKHVIVTALPQLTVTELK